LAPLPLPPWLAQSPTHAGAYSCPSKGVMPYLLAAIQGDLSQLSPGIQRAAVHTLPSYVQKDKKQSKWSLACICLAEFDG
jgi:hypothetical protein